MYITTDEEFVKEINKLNPALIECAEDLRKRIYESDLNYYKNVVKEIFEIEGYKEALDSHRGIPLNLTQQADYILSVYHVPKDLRSIIEFYSDELERYVKMESYNETFKIIKNLQNKVNKHCGKLKNFDIHFNSEGICGIAEGENGTCTIASILAGGYNIQRLHIRCLVKPLKNK